MTVPTDLRRDEALRSLRDQVATPVALPGEPGYERCRPWNVVAPVEPAAVVLATSPEDVAGTVRFAAAHGFRVTVQATGHGAVGVGPDTILIQTSAMRHVSVDVVNGTARVGAGARWQDVLDVATPHGLAPLCGSAPGVGVIGYLTGGGIGPLVRTYGLSSDHVRSFDVVTGGGRLLRAAPDENADLFWGLRGGKATLGIVTSAEIDLLPVPEFYGGAVYFAADDVADVLRAWAAWCVDLPETINTSIAIQQLPPLPEVPEPLAGRMTVAVRYAAVGDVDEAEQALAPMRAVATPVLDTVGVLPYAAIGAVHADPVDPMPINEDQALLRELPPEAVEALLAAAGPESGSPQAIVELRHLGGALAREATHRSAFCHRNAAFSLAVIGVPAPEIADMVIAHAGAVTGAVAPWSTGGQMPNFAPSYDPARPSRVYTDDTLHWLAGLADRYDPARTLATGQVIRTVV
ncbi:MULTISPECIES: FAD-binding oxidoreductase [Mycolicibacterium]|uniref:FAD linked oxidase domain-containing protein n=2 Tax=Mycolicibacterium gilvum TaxID=1804 RepID=A0A378SHR8_9MYCO|nr:MULTISPECIES: FAD-binding oxidoreductase [Mycolicibacterium]ABP47119.1 FAD linked oxidase domain protein [Mycolicibacterium gilvum PYR-GCK]MBV5245495.1 FAD-binding oxidoreductase [Mycolicibacterium sp. PAM1]MCV7055068.1 FAD-binding oxidoreductase [Mycolicibacterium gilvum]STZ42382.1 FAD linked oxidase domain-containing protein [Mycolicibacterium gilvum]